MHVANAMLAPHLGRALGSARTPVSFFVPRTRGMARRRGACPGLLQGGPIRVRASPDRRTLALMTRAPAPLGAPPRLLLVFAFQGSGPRRRLSTYGGLPESRPRTWLRKPHPRVPRPVPLRTTPRPKRPSVDGTAITNSESHLKCQ